MEKRSTGVQIIGIMKECEAKITLKDLTRKHRKTDQYYYRLKSITRRRGGK